MARNQQKMKVKKELYSIKMSKFVEIIFLTNEQACYKM